MNNNVDKPRKKSNFNPYASKNNMIILAVTALLIAIGIIIPMIMPFPFKIVIEPASYTLASHVAIFLAMFISPISAVAVALGTTAGFFFGGFPITIVIRAATHLLFALLGSLYLKKFPSTLDSILKSQIFSLIIALIHGACEAIAVTFAYSGGVYTYTVDKSPYFVIGILIGLGSVLHSMIDFTIAFFLRKALMKNREIKKIFL